MSVLRCKSNLVGGWVCGSHDITRGRFLRLRVLAHTLWKLDTIKISIGWLFLGSWLALQKCVWSKFMDTSYIQTADAPTFKDSHIAGQKVYIEIKNNHCDASSDISCLFSFQLFTFSCLRITKMNLTCTQQTPKNTHSNRTSAGINPVFLSDGGIKGFFSNCRTDFDTSA